MSSLFDQGMDCDIQISIVNRYIVGACYIFLGVILISKNLNWKSEISRLANKVVKSVGMITK